MKQVVVVGASLAGVSASEALREAGYSGRIVMVGAEPHPPYDRPPLSKQVLTGEWTTAQAILDFDPDRTSVEMVLGVQAVGLDVAARVVFLANGTELSYDGLVVATGVRPRLLSDVQHHAGLHLLRTLDDSLQLGERIQEGTRLIVLGGGFLGAEVAASARYRGCEVTVVESETGLVSRLGPDIAALVTELHRSHGVRLLMGAQPDAIVVRHGQITGLMLSDGSELAADDVVVAIGSTPNVDWLDDSTLPIRNGLECDRFCRAAPNIVAAGDVASWIDRDGKRRRLEHRMNAVEQAQTAVAALLGRPDTRPYTPSPYFWTDQYGTRIQVFGDCNPSDETHVLDGSMEQGKFVQARLTSGFVTGVLGWNNPKKARQACQWLGRSWSEVANAAG
ncbi:NAD(P)/FAD-dependent oxidoreductase [Nocardia brasiliensis]